MLRVKKFGGLSVLSIRYISNDFVMLAQSSKKFLGWGPIPLSTHLIYYIKVIRHFIFYGSWFRSRFFRPEISSSNSNKNFKIVISCFFVVLMKEIAPNEKWYISVICIITLQCSVDNLVRYWLVSYNNIQIEAFTETVYYMKMNFH